MQTTIRTAEQQEYVCRADADAAAAQLRAVPPAYHRVDVTVEERPVYGRGRPSPHKPRPVKTLRSRLKITLNPQTERIRRLEEEAGCFVLLTNVPTAGDSAHNAGAVLKGYKEQHGTEQHYGFLKDPVIVNSLFLKKPERIEALGLVVLLALLIWRVMERTMRTYVTTTPPLTGWDKQATERPTSFMMVTKFAGVIVLKHSDHRQLARPLSVVQQQYLTALDVPATCCTACPSGEEGGDARHTPLAAAEAYPTLVGC
jgi:hypothetical protein